MISELKDTYKYPRVIALISFLSFVFGVATCFLGELFLPLASSFLAILFLFEKSDKRFCSYVCPAASILASVLLKGIAAIITIEYILLAVIIAFCYKKSLTKAETSIYLTLVVAAFVFISLYLGAAVFLETFSPSEILDYYVKAFVEFKQSFIEAFSGFTITANDGTEQNAMSVEEATLYFNVIYSSFIGIIGVFAFLISGLTLKIYTALVLKYSKHGILKKFSHFIPSNFCAYAYIVSAILSALSSDTSKFGLVLLNVNVIMMAVFAYMGARYILMLIKHSERKGMIYFILAASCLAFSSVVPSIISYLGVWVVIGTNSHNKASNN